MKANTMGNEETPLDSAYQDHRKKTIIEAAERLLSHMSFEDMTVSDICQAAGISRPTFYRYFRDKYDMAQWYWNLLGNRYLRECGRSLDWYESNLGMLKEFKRGRGFFNPAIADDGDLNSCLKHGYRQRIEYLRETICNLNPTLYNESIAFQVSFFADAESRAIAAWLNDGMPISPERLSRFIESCIPPELHTLIDLSFRQNRKPGN